MKKIRSNYQPNSFDNPILTKHNRTRLTFNFSFLTEEKGFNLNKNNGVSREARLKLLEKIQFLSVQDKADIMMLPKETGLERLHESYVDLRVHGDFINSGRNELCGDKYWIFRLNKLGRVIGKIDNEVFYILAIDTKFKLYKH
ncbi:hypothetical protein [Limosilactobacillus equigenerosi]|uniref:hypothetical protein n=1 Tax=Limosilactobacillus equigenerosi TaxID=417373 RepID=UPI000704D69A|nr:hypothetical protein [Limosilactobacillus equigenerosi]